MGTIINLDNEKFKKFYIDNSWEESWSRDLDMDFIPKDNDFRTRLFETIGMIKGQPNFVLDVGCGIGLYDIAIAKKFPKTKIIGIDISKRQIELAKNIARQRGVKNIEFLCCDAEKFNFNTLFDCIICTELLEHFLDPANVLANIYKHSNNNTQIIFSVPQYYGTGAGLYYRVVYPDGRISESKNKDSLPQSLAIYAFYHGTYNIDKLRKLLSKNGFKLELIKGVTYKPWEQNYDYKTNMFVDFFDRAVRKSNHLAIITDEIASKLTFFRHSKNLLARCRIKYNFL